MDQQSLSFRVYPVVLNGRYVGYVTLDTLLSESKEKSVGEIVTFSDPIEPETSLHNIMKRMIAEKETHIYVVNDDRLVGVVSQSDVIRTIF